jgi:hypothetical protein
LKRGLIIVGSLLAITALWMVVRTSLPSYIDYRDQKIKLSKFYLDYDDYKNDPDNIDKSETLRVQRLVSEAPIASSFPGRKEAVHAVFEIKFPGYGAGGLGPIQKEDGALNGLSVEIPRAGANRYFIFRNKSGEYALVDDFILSDLSGIRDFHQDGGNLVYTTGDGRKLVHSLRTP